MDKRDKLAKDHNVIPAMPKGIIDLETQTPVPLSRAEKKERQPRLGIPGREETRPLAAMEAAAQFVRLVLLGAPGAGKSTFVQRLLARLASAQLGELKKPLPGVPGDLLPVLVTLRDLAPRLAHLRLDNLSETARRETLSSLVLELAGQNLSGLRAAAFAPRLRAAPSCRVRDRPASARARWTG